MKQFVDLHNHSKHAQACSNDLNIDTMEKWARIKGTDILGTGDFTHPIWSKELKEKLSDNDGTGIFKTKTGQKFMLQTEISLIYTDLGHGRKTHNLILCPNFEVMDQITAYFLSKGRVDYDGRPIFKIPCPQLVEDMRSISKEIEIIPAHIWTPWFSLFGSNSGWDSIKDCFKDQVNHIHALETGLSSNPPMNWRLSQLDKFNIVSFSDSHSYWPWRYGRECTIFDIPENKLSYDEIIKALRNTEPDGKKGLVETIEVDPNYGKYHWDGHRKCGIKFSPEQSKKHNRICPVCKEPLTIGVDYRVEELADRPEGFVRKNALPFRTILPLSEILGNILKKAMTTKTVWSEYWKIMKTGTSENNVLFNVPHEKLLEVTSKEIADAIIRNRNGEIKVLPGYDGVYGVPILSDTVKDNVQPLSSQEEGKKGTQKGLQDYFFSK